VGEIRNAYRTLHGKPEEKTALAKSKRRWVNNVKSDLKEAGCESIVWIQLTQGSVQRRVSVNTVMNIGVL
jgi:uncharacterized protein YecT (DUF1311 family)